MIACTVCASRGRVVRVVPLGPRGDVLAHASPVTGFADLLVLDLLFDHEPAPYRFETPYTPLVPAMIRWRRP